MKIIVDTNDQTIVHELDGKKTTIGLYTNQGFDLISKIWLKVGWNQKYPYTFTWMGRPVIQIPEDLIRLQEVIYKVRPDVIVETGVAHGGSLVFSASLCKVIGKGRVVGIDVEIRPHNRALIENHELFSLITLVEGSSTHPEIVKKVKSSIQPHESVLVILDSNHTRRHVLDELDAYHTLVTPGSYIVSTDGIMQNLHDVPRGKTEWENDNPARAAVEFSQRHPEFILEQPAWIFNESELNTNITHWPSAWLRRL